MTIATCTEDFAVTWNDPADARLTWMWDPMHFPRPVAPLTGDIVGRAWAAFMGARSVFLNGYMYDWNASPPPPTPEVIERGAAPVWEHEYVPRLREFCERLRTSDYDGMSAVELADALDQIIGDAVEHFRLTMVVIFAFMGPTFALVDFAEKEIGPDGPQLVASLLQGYQNGSAAAGAGLGDLAMTAAASKEVATAIRDGRVGALESVEGGREFLAKLRSYLDEYGWRAESWGLAHVPTWAEDPSVPLTLIGRYLNDGTTSPAEAIERSVRQREEAQRDMERRLSGEKLAEFRAMLDVASPHVSISEGRAQYQLTIVGSVRVPVLALGRKLVDLGALDEPNDAFFLHLSELQQAAREPAPMQALVAGRKADLQRWEKATPPPFVGAPPSEPPPEMAPMLARFFGLGVVPSTEANLVKGNPANPGVVRGRARVIRELSEAGRLQQGEVLVCPSTAPPWTPLFAIAAAVVTDTGGILSHSAICAREYGLPCIVGTQAGTRQIPDGALITVDGGKGTVRIEG